MIRPTPRLNEIEAKSEMISGQQFLARITGQDFETATIYLEVVGPGCPESKPCKIPNSALLEKAKLTDTVIEDVPFTLTTGDFKITAHNADSPPSNPVYLKVP